MNLEVENIQHPQIKNMNLTVCDLQYRSLHLHPEIELILILKGSTTLNINGNTKTFHEKEVVLINANELHEIISKTETSTLLSLHILPQYFEGYFPQMTFIKFEDNTFVSKNEGMFIYTFCKLLKTYLSKDPYYQLQCAGLINIMVYDILQNCSYHQIYNSKLQQTTKQSRLLSEILNYIEEHYAEKLTLANLSEYLGLSTSYLSHFIIKNLHQSFSEFLTYTRYFNAKALLMNSELSLTEICYNCGFSDYRYMNNAFKKYSSCTPNEFKKKINTTTISTCKEGILKLYSPQEMLDNITEFMKNNHLDEYNI